MKDHVKIDHLTKYDALRVSRDQEGYSILMYQEKMRGQRGRLPVQALGYVNSTKVILGLLETAGVHFLLRPHHYILKVITQFGNGGLRANTSMEASFTGILERNGISGWINQRGIYIFTTCWE